MNFPKLLTAAAIVNFLLVLMYMFLGFAGIISLSENDMLNVMWVNLVLFLNIGWILGVIAIVLLFKKSAGYVSAIFYCMISVLAPFVILLLLSMHEGVKTFDAGTVVILTVIGIPPLWLAFLLLKPAHRAWAGSFGPILPRLYRPRYLIPFLSILIAANGGMFLINRVGIVSDLTGQNVSFTASSEQPYHAVRNVNDHNSTTCWIPGFSEGVNEWIKADLSGEEFVSELKISFEGKDGEFGSYSRGKSILAETSSGEQVLRELPDNPGLHEIPLNGGNYTWIRIKFISTYAGKKENALCVSEVRIVTRKKDFIKLSF
jgi:hypothetical protein